MIDDGARIGLECLVQMRQAEWIDVWIGDGVEQNPVGLSEQFVDVAERQRVDEQAANFKNFAVYPVVKVGIAQMYAARTLPLEPDDVVGPLDDADRKFGISHGLEVTSGPLNDTQSSKWEKSSNLSSCCASKVVRYDYMGFPKLLINFAGGFALKRRNMKLYNNYYRLMQSGFTLLELLVVMVIIGLLVGYVGPRYFSQIGKSEVKAAAAQISALEKALDMYRLDTGHYPAGELGLKALVEKPSSEPRWSGPYLSKGIPPDPWGNAYLYRMPGANGEEYEVLSLGKDGRQGGEGEAADISSSGMTVSENKS